MKLMNINENALRGQVIERIRAVRGQTRLLVVDAKADSFFHKHRLPLSGSLPFVTICPSQPPSDYNQQQQQHGMQHYSTGGSRLPNLGQLSPLFPPLPSPLSLTFPSPPPSFPL